MYLFMPSKENSRSMNASLILDAKILKNHMSKISKAATVKTCKILM